MVESSRSTTGAGEAGSCRDDRARARGGAGRGGARIPAARVVIEDQRDSRARRGEGGRGDEESCSGITTGIACTRRRDSIARTRDVAVTGRACASARRGRGDHRGHDHRRPETRSSVNAVHRSTRPGSWVEAIPSGADGAAFQPHPSSLVERRRTAPFTDAPGGATGSLDAGLVWVWPGRRVRWLGSPR